MAIAYRSSSSTSSSGTSTIVTLPAGTTTDDIVLFAVFWNGAPGTITFPTGFTEITQQADTNVSGLMSVHWKRAGGSEGASYTATSTNSVVSVAYCVTFSGALATGNIIDTFASDSYSFNSSTTPLKTTSGIAATVSATAHIGVAAMDTGPSATDIVAITDNNSALTFTDLGQIGGPTGKGAPIMRFAYAIDTGSATTSPKTYTTANTGYGAIIVFNFKQTTTGFTFTPIAIYNFGTA
jgi:hypothetical protein